MKDQVKNIITDELNDFLNMSNIKFVVNKNENRIVSILICIGEITRGKKYIKIPQLVVTNPEEYLTHGIRIISHVKSINPNITFYGFIKENNKYALEMVSLLGGKITADFFDPNHKYIDGWHTYYC